MKCRDAKVFCIASGIILGFKSVPRRIHSPLILKATRAPLPGRDSGLTQLLHQVTSVPLKQQRTAGGLLTEAHPVVAHAEQRAAQTQKQRHDKERVREETSREATLCLLSLFTLAMLDLMSGCGRALFAPLPSRHKHFTSHPAAGGTGPFISKT